MHAESINAHHIGCTITGGQSLPWIGDCVNKIDVTNIGQQHDLIDLARKEPLDLDAELILQEPAE